MQHIKKDVRDLLIVGDVVLMESYDLGNEILEKHMQVTRPGFYAGRGPCTSDLDGVMLYRIFKDLHEVSPEFGENFIRLVDSIPSIGATEFIYAYRDFSRNGFLFEEKKETEEPGIEGTNDKEKMQSAACFIGGALGIFSTNDTPEQAMAVSNSIKSYFYRLANKFYKGVYGESFSNYEDSKVSKDVHMLIDPFYRYKCEYYEQLKRMRQEDIGFPKTYSFRTSNKQSKD